MPGLYEILTSKTDGAIVRSLDDESTKFVSSRVHNLSHLESIEIYTTGENVALADVFNAMKSSTDTMPDVKDNKALKAYFEKTYPEMDTERVYASDMKKMINWFAVLQKHNIDYTVKEEPQEEEVVEVEKEKKPEAKASTKAEAKPAAEKEPKEAPAKKTASAKKGTTATADTNGKEAKEPAKKKAAPAKKKKSEE